MSPQFIKTVQDFLVDYDNTINDFTSLADYDLWLETAVNLLQQSVADDYKIPVEQNNDTTTNTRT